MKRPLLVLKIGTSSITTKDGQLDKDVVIDVARQVSLLNKTYRIAIVSSGAVGTGKRFLKRFSGKLIERKAAAAIGNPILVQTYSRYFAEYGIPIAQSLCERSHFSDRSSFLRLRQTFEILWKNGVIPVANENDVVSDLELRFSDNDELATLLAIGFNAESLLVATSVPGLLDAAGNIVREVSMFDETILGLARKEKSAFGLGGMISKLTFAKLATRMGIRVTIFGLDQPDSILDAAQGIIGTVCTAQVSGLNARQKWLASGSLVTGAVFVDDGAARSVKKRSSLLAVGLTRMSGSFDRGEVIEIHAEAGELIALARAQTSSSELSRLGKIQNLTIAHADEIILV